MVKVPVVVTVPALRKKPCTLPVAPAAMVQVPPVIFKRADGGMFKAPFTATLTPELTFAEVLLMRTTLNEVGLV